MHKYNPCTDHVAVSSSAEQIDAMAEYPRPGMVQTWGGLLRLCLLCLMCGAVSYSMIFTAWYYVGSYWLSLPWFIVAALTFCALTLALQFWLSLRNEQGGAVGWHPDNSVHPATMGDELDDDTERRN